MATTPATFQDFDAIRIRLGESLASISRAFGALDAVDRAAELDCVRTDLLSDSFRVLVFGEMKRGKSQLINAMLGEPLLPSKPMPCTAIACNVRYGDPKRAVLHRRQENPTETIDLTHSPSALQDAVVIRTFHESDDGLDVELAIERHPFVEADIYAPLALCRLGVEIQDSPGLNENPTRTAEARRKLKSADAVVIVLASDTPLSQSERALVSEVLRDRDARDVFFVWNRFDTIRDKPGAAEELRRLSDARLGSRVGAHARVFYLSAEEGLLGRWRAQPELVERSGMRTFECALESFLVVERSVAKLRRPLQVGQAAASEGLFDLLLQRERLYRMPLEAIREKLEEAQPRLAAADKNRQSILAALDRQGDAIERDLAAEVMRLGGQLENGIPVRLKSVDISTWDAVASRDAAKQRLAAQVSGWAREQTETWYADTVLPLIERHESSLRREVELIADAMLGNLREAKSAAFGGPVDAEHVSREEEVSAASRLLGAGLGLLGGAGSILEGATLGVGAAARGLIVNVVAGIFMTVVFGVTAPAAIAVLLTVGVLRTILGAQSFAESLRSKVGVELQAGVRTKLPELEREVMQEIRSTLLERRKKVDGLLRSRVHEVQEQIDSVLRERESHQDNLGHAMAKLGALRRLLQEEAANLAEIRSLIEPAMDPAVLANRVGVELEPKLSAAVSHASGQGAVPVVPGVGRAEMRARIGREGWARLEAAKRLLESEGRWKAMIEDSVVLAWYQCAVSLEPSATAQSAAFRTVVTLALAEGESMPPPVSALRRRWLDVAYRTDLVRLYVAVTGESDGTFFLDDGPGEFGRAGDRFTKAYERALQTIEPRIATAELRKGTAIDGKLDRDPPAKRER